MGLGISLLPSGHIPGYTHPWTYPSTTAPASDTWWLSLETYLPPHEQTHACENSTFPQLLLRAVIEKCKTEWKGNSFLSKIRSSKKRRSLGQGNVFTPVCHTVHRGVVSQHATDGGVHPLGRHPSPGRHPPSRQLKRAVRILLECFLVRRNFTHWLCIWNSKKQNLLVMMNITKHGWFMTLYFKEIYRVIWVKDIV